MQFLANIDVGDAVQGNVVVPLAPVSGLSGRAGEDVGNNKLTLPDTDKLPGFGHTGADYRRGGYSSMVQQNAA